MQQATLTISEIVRKDYRTADVFKKHGINYCCGGNSTLDEVCQVKNLSKSIIEQELGEITKHVTIPSSVRFDNWSVDFLVDYINNVHHAYLKTHLPALELHLLSFVNGHRRKFSFLDALLDTYKELADLVLTHTKEEEGKIFPYIKQIAHTHKNKEVYGRLFVKTMSKPLTQVLQSDHKHITAQLLQLRSIANQYQFDDAACTNHRVVFQKLQELDNDLVQHKYLENNILFPKAIIMEQDLINL